ncbi:MAG: acetylglutamate kinase [Lachnospirales bacterium]
MVSNQVKSEILVNAIPYIQKYFGKIVVIKYGGSAMLKESLKNSVMEDIVLLNLIGVKVVLVHGGGPEINGVLEKMGKESKFIDGLRYTDEETIDIVQMVLSGKVNKDLVALIEQLKGKAIGLCGIDNSMIKAKKISGVDLGYVGEVTEVNTKPILEILENGHIPVIATLGIGENNKKYNINADTAASKIASSLGAENLILLTDTLGILRDKEDDETLIEEIYLKDIDGLIEEGVVQGGMIPKIKCCEDAVKCGVKKAVILDGRIEHSILVEMLTNEGVGTMVKKVKL